MSEAPDWYLPRGFATAELPGTGGVAKASAADFEVEELPAYEPCGTGDHLFLWVEKRGMASEAMLSALARGLGVRRNDIGCAGLKDTQAVTRQYVSVPATAASRLDRLADCAPPEQLRVLRSARHGNKLRTGHLRGNRFTVKLRDCLPEAWPRAQAIAARLSQHGLPNFYGPQRFGRDGRTLQLGIDLLRGAAPGAKLPGSLRRLALSSVQSALFNAYLGDRLAEGLLFTVLPGEVLQVCASGGPFVSDDVATEQRRFAAREVVPAGPMFGPKMRSASASAQAREVQVLHAHGLDEAHFATFGKLTAGTRRANVVWPDNLTVRAVEPRILALSFGLPAGSYATVLLGEFSKSAA